MSTITYFFPIEGDIHDAVTSLKQHKVILVKKEKKNPSMLRTAYGEGHTASTRW